MKQERQNGKHKVIISMGIALAVLGLIVILIVRMQSDRLNEIDTELARAMTYEQVKEGEEVVEGTSNCVQFNAFFLRDLDEDGYAERIKGTCKEIGKEDTLYLELNVLTEGSLKNPIITVNANNFYFNTAIVKDEQVKSNYINTNTKKIELNTIENGTQKLLTGNVRTGDYSQKTTRIDAIGKDTTKYSRVNQVVLTGTYVAKDGTETEIRKEIDLTVDWYGKVTCSIPETYKNDMGNRRRTIYVGKEKEDRTRLSFKVVTQETANQLILSKSYIEGTIPELNGYKPLDVKISGTNVEYTYNKETGKYTAQRKAEVDETGNIISNAYTTVWWNNIYNEYEFLIEYPEEAYDAIEEFKKLVIPIAAHYEGYNNDNEEFDTPYKSNVVDDNITISLETQIQEEITFQIYMGDFVKEPIHRWIVSKSKPTQLYNNAGKVEEKDYYPEEWVVQINDSVEKSGIIMKDTRNLLVDENEVQKTNEFLKSDKTTAGEMGDIVKYTGLYFERNDPRFLKEDNGWIRVYNDETNELLVEFTNDEYKQYDEENPYYYDEGVSHIRIETSTPVTGVSLGIINIKEVDDQKLTDRYTREEFETLKYIRGRLSGYVNFGTDGTDDIRYIETKYGEASYENRMSIAQVEAQPKATSTQTTSGNNIIIKAVRDEKNNQDAWINGTFLLKFPKEIIDLHVNAVRVNDTHVQIDNYEVYEEDGNFYIKIYTSNTIEVGFNIIVDCDMTSDPIISTTNTKIELYASNEQAEDYYYSGIDQYDVNNNANVQEIVSYSTSELILVSPSSLLTSSSASEYDSKGSITVAPRIAKIDKNQREAKVSINITNNYGGTISDIVIMGRIPFVGNSYVINGKDLNSQFTTTMKAAGIEVPDDLKAYTQIYYTTNENPTIDVENKENGWVTAENVENWDNIKSYIVVFEDYVMPDDKTFIINYKLNIPEGLNYNEVSYCTHAVNFSLDTDEGKYRTKVESNKLGFMIAEQYDLELTKYQSKTDKALKGATYIVTDTQTQEARSAVTDENGKLIIKGLYAEKEYTIKETKTPQEYQLNEDEIKINTQIDEQGNLQVNKVNGTTRNINVTKGEGKDWKVKLEVEDEPKARLQIIKTDKQTGEKLKGAQFKIIGDGKGGTTFTTNQEGEISSKGFLLGEEYTIEETKANGYFLMREPVKFIITREDSEYKFNLTNGEVYKAELTKQDEIPVLTLELQNEPRPTYQLQIVKVEKNTTDTLSGAKFKIEGPGMDQAQNDTTNEAGQITIDGLYIGTDENDEVEYTLTETEAPQGYIKTLPIKLKAYNQGEQLQVDIISGEVKETNINGNIVSLTIEDKPVFKLEKKDGEIGTLLPNVKFALYAIGANAEESFATNARGEVLGELETINGETYRVLKTDENGQITADLAEGLYKVVELETLEKYEIPEEIEERSYYFGVGNSRAGEVELNQEWKMTIEGGQLSYNTNVIQTSDGGYLTSGYFTFPKITLPNGEVLTNHGGGNSFIMKYNAEGEIEWADTVGGSGYDVNYKKIVETTDGNYILAGQTSESSITLSNGDVLSNRSYSTDIVIVKYDTKGNILWSDIIGGTSSENISAILETSDGGVMLGANVGSNSITSSRTGKEITIESDECSLLLQYDKNGNIEWNKANPFQIGGIAKAGNDEYIVEGQFTGSITLANGEIITSQNQDIIVARYDKRGNVIWYDMISGSGSESFASDMPNGIVPTEDGGYLVVGLVSSDSLILSNGDELFGSTNRAQGFVIKYSEDGKIEWSYQAKKSAIYGVVATKDDGFVLLDINNITKFNKKGEEQWSQNIEFSIGGLVETDDEKYVIGGCNTGKGIIAKYDVAVYPEVENLMDANVTPAVTQYYSVWGEMVGGTGTDNLNKICATSDGGYITGKSFEDTITLSDGTTYTSNGKKDALVIKYNQDNEIEWSDTFGSIDDDYYYGFAQTEDGGYIAVGEFRDTIRLSNDVEITVKGGNVDADGIIVKYDNEGNIVWYDTIASSAYDFIIDAIGTKDGGCIVAGHYSASFVLSNGSNITNAGSRDGIIIKYDSEGNIVWYKQINGNEYDSINSIKPTNDDGFIIAGLSGSSGRFFKDDEYISNKGENDAFVAKYDGDGNVQWVDTFGGVDIDQAFNAVQINDGGYVVVAKWQGGNIGLSNKEVVQRKGDSDGLLIKYDSNGKIEYHREIYSLNGWDAFNGVTALREGGFAVIGLFQRQNATLSTGETITNARGYTDNAIIKFSNDGKVLNTKTLENTPHIMDMKEIVQLENGDIVLCGSTTAHPALQLDSRFTVNHHGGYNSYDGYILRCKEIELEAEKPGNLELKVDNNRKEYNIKTKVEPINGIKGGSISGEKDFIYETVKYGDSNTKSIVMTPDTNYEIIKITVNGEEQKFTANADGTYTMPTFTDITEDKEVVVTYVLSSNKIEIEKVDAEDNNIKLEGAKIRLERIPNEEDATEYEVELETNSEGKIVTQLPYGTYRVTEIEAPEGYQINTAIANIEFVQNGTHTFTIQDYEKPSVIVHHMLKDRTGNYTDTKLAEDEIYYGDKGDSYVTKPKLDIVGYDLEKNEDEEYVVPDNATGVYGEGKIIVTYYYEEKQIPLTVHYYIEGTENQVPLDNNKLAQDLVTQGNKGEIYTTQSLTNVNEKYELVEVPSNSNGTYGDEEIVVIYYYKLKTAQITTKVIEHEETDSLGQVSKVQGGSISGEGQKPYETVIYGEDSTKEIIITPDEGYQVKTIKINGEEITFTANDDKIVELSKFEDLREDQEVEVEFEKITGTVIVHHYIEGTTTKVPAKDTEVVEDEIKTGFVGNIYATKPSENASDAYEFLSSIGETNGTYTKDDIVVIYYYKLREPKITASKELTTDNSRKYVVPGEKITYKITVKNEGNLEKDVVVRDNIPEGTTFVEGSIKIDEEAKAEMVAEDLANGITINVPEAGEEGASVKTLSFEVTVKEDTTGNIANRAIVDDEETNEVTIPTVSYETSIDKTSKQDKITSKDTNVYYEIEFNATVNDFEGKAIATIVDTLPYPINEEKSDLDGGNYDADMQTITWQQEISNIDTFSSSEAHNIKITKAISLSYAYENLDNTAESMKNEVKGTIKLQAPKKENPTEYETIGENTSKAEEETKMEIATEVRVHHYIYDAETGVNTTIKLADDEIKSGIIGEEYTTSKSTKVPANYSCISEQPENYTGKMKEAPIDVNYYYQLITPTIENSAQKTVIANKTDENGVAVLTKEDGVVTYNLTYDINIKDYMGKATATIVDTLPAKIDMAQSNLAGGTYNEAKNTITWEEEINNINTFANGNYTKKISKQITVVYEKQNVLKDLVNTVTGKIKTYYPEKHLNKGGKDFVNEEKVDDVSLKQEYKANIKVVKVWDDNENLKGKRPNSVTIKITPSNGTAITAELNQANKWTYENKGLPKYDEATGKKITYTITETETEKGDLEHYEKAVITTEELQTNEVTNYQYTVTNAYKLTNTNLNTQLTKTGTEEITNANTAIDYTINLKAEIGNYIGGGKVVIVDTLPYKVDVTKSDLAEGVYDDEKQTITFEQELPHINTETTKESYKIDITKQLKLVYKDIDLAGSKITNTVNGKIELYETDQKDEKTVSFDTNINVQGKVIVKYVNKINQKEIADREEIVGKVGKKYTTNRKQIENYNYVESTNNATGTIKAQEQEVIYYYEPLETSVLVKYQDKNGKKIAADVLIKGYLGDIYKTEKKDIDNYKLVEIKGEAQGVMTKNQIEVIYVYDESNRAKVIVKYLEKQPEGAKEIELLPSDTIEGRIGDNYEVARKVVENYRAVEPEPTNATGKMTQEPIEVIYYYEKIPGGKINIKYVDVETGKEITHGENEEVYGYQITGFVGDKYQTKQTEIPYYAFVKSTDNRTGTLTEVGDTVIYYYRKLDFNISLEKTISSITLKGRNVSLFDNQLAKVEIHAKELENTDLLIKYNIKVTNKGELAGKAKVLDKLPDGCDLIELPEYWSMRPDGVLESEVDLEVGESKDLMVTLKWIKGQSNLGTKSNIAEIESTENAAQYEESDTKDNMSEATVIIGIRTGEWINKIMIIVLVISLVVCTYIIISLEYNIRKESK